MKVLVENSRSWWLFAAFLALASLLVSFDIAEEPVRSGVEVVRDGVESILFSAALVIVAFLALRHRRQHEEQMELLRDLDRARAEGVRWRAEAGELINGLGAAIDGQFERWGLTPAEREVGLLLLKGLSHREIAVTRSTSERTARQQARSVYRKAGLNGRVSLSAFFLEDLLLPADQRQTSDS